ncbi:MAG: hypothetical protein ACXVJ4_08660 [Acidimicrobiia bacterium]
MPFPLHLEANALSSADEMAACAVAFSPAYEPVTVEVPAVPGRSKPVDVPLTLDHTMWDGLTLPPDDFHLVSVVNVVGLVPSSVEHVSEPGADAVTVILPVLTVTAGLPVGLPAPPLVQFQRNLPLIVRVPAAGVLVRGGESLTFPGPVQWTAPEASNGAGFAAPANVEPVASRPPDAIATAVAAMANRRIISFSPRSSFPTLCEQSAMKPSCRPRGARSNSLRIVLNLRTARLPVQQSLAVGVRKRPGSNLFHRRREAPRRPRYVRDARS